MRPIHLGVLLLIATVVGIGVLDRRPRAYEAADAPAGGERTHIVYWEKWGGFEAEACQAMVNVFNRSQDRIRVHYVRTSQVDQKSMLAVIGGNPPDIAGLWAINIPPFADADALVPLDDLRRRAGIDDDVFVPNYLNLCQYKGTTYAMPNTPATIGLFWNKRLFRTKADELRAAGLDPQRAPRTIAELDRYAEVLTEYGPDGEPEVMGFLPTDPGWFHTSWPYHFGGTLYDERTGEVTTDLPENIDAYTWVKSYAEKYGRQKVLRFRSGFGNYDSPQNPFIDGKLAMIMQGVWFPAFVQRHRPTMEYGAAPFPTAPGVEGPRGLIDCDVLTIPRGCPHPEAAWEFLKFVVTGGEYERADGSVTRVPPGLATICRLQGKHLPIRRGPDWWDREHDTPFLEWFRQGHPNPFLETFEALARSPHSFRLPQNLVWQQYNQEIVSAFEHIWRWPVPEKKLEGLKSKRRQEAIRRLCREEVARVLRDVRVRMQRQLDQRRRREAIREGSGAP